jgi:hypothetical protein
MAREIIEQRPVPASRANEYLSNLVEEGGKKQHYDEAKTRIPDDGKSQHEESGRAAPTPSEE